MFPGWRALLEQDSLFSINGFWHPALRDSRPVIPVVGAVKTRRSAFVQCLNAIYTDLDFYRTGMNFDTVAAEIARRVKAGILPPPSFGLKARGVWLLWLLRSDDDPESPPQANSSCVRQYRLIQDELHRLLYDVGSDGKARDIARLARVPGSLHSGIGQRVSLLLSGDEHAPTLVYRLAELTTLLNLDTSTPPHPKPRRAHSDSVATPRKSGWSGVYRHHLAQFKLLRSLRGGFRQGCRNHAALLYAAFLFRYWRDVAGSLEGSSEAWP